MALDDVELASELEQEAAQKTLFTPDTMLETLQKIDPDIDPHKGILRMLTQDTNNHLQDGMGIENVETSLKAALNSPDGPQNDTNIAYVQAALNRIIAGADGSLASNAAQHTGGLTRQEQAKKNAKRNLDDSILRESTQAALEAAEREFADNTGGLTAKAWMGLTRQEKETNVETHRAPDLRQRTEDILEQNPDMSEEDANDQAMDEIIAEQNRAAEAIIQMSQEARAARDITNRSDFSQHVGASLNAGATQQDYLEMYETLLETPSGSPEEMFDQYVAKIEAQVSQNGKDGAKLVDIMQRLEDQITSLEASPLANHPSTRTQISNLQEEIDAMGITMEETTATNIFLTDLKTFMGENREALLSSSPEESLGLAFKNPELMSSFQNIADTYGNEQFDTLVKQTASSMGLTEEYATSYMRTILMHADAVEEAELLQELQAAGVGVGQTEADKAAADAAALEAKLEGLEDGTVEPTTELEDVLASKNSIIKAYANNRVIKDGVSEEQFEEAMDYVVEAMIGREVPEEYMDAIKQRFHDEGGAFITETASAEIPVESEVTTEAPAPEIDLAQLELDKPEVQAKIDDFFRSNPTISEAAFLEWAGENGINVPDTPSGQRHFVNITAQGLQDRGISRIDPITPKADTIVNNRFSTMPAATPDSNELIKGAFNSTAPGQTPAPEIMTTPEVKLAAAEITANIDVAPTKMGVI